MSITNYTRSWRITWMTIRTFFCTSIYTITCYIEICWASSASTSIITGIAISGSSNTSSAYAINRIKISITIYTQSLRITCITIRSSTYTSSAHPIYWIIIRCANITSPGIITSVAVSRSSNTRGAYSISIIIIFSTTFTRIRNIKIKRTSCTLSWRITRITIRSSSYTNTTQTTCYIVIYCAINTRSIIITGNAVSSSSNTSFAYTTNRIKIR